MSRYLHFRHIYGGCFVAEHAGRSYPAMGTLDDGTMCSYCCAEEAFYIPDGCCGPMCGSCMDLGIERGYDQVNNLRLMRWVRGKLWRISPRLPTRAHIGAEAVLHDPQLALQIATFLVWVTDGAESWWDHDYDYEEHWALADEYEQHWPSGWQWEDPDPSPRCASESP